jgi:hypothetical protein
MDAPCISSLPTHQDAIRRRLRMRGSKRAERVRRGCVHRLSTPAASARQRKGFPERALEPGGATYPPFLGPFPPSEHLTGPWQPIRPWQKDNAETLRRDPAAPGR